MREIKAMIRSEHLSDVLHAGLTRPPTESYYSIEYLNMRTDLR